ncbi:NAD(P)-binding protein [Hyaloscypha hepaticicola]|uniref:NAD(P)-binding protein n=1 Tax=Hyaloscypha hepaticicola TaxID=2082293 RepID=A0A2J6PWZ1_9HELO|nr:NAD(P)-binding protein [Hyaloscypha hepaticicola]
MRNILEAGATGKQGQALIRALLHPTATSPEQDLQIFALTRKASSPAAKRLAEANPSNLKIVEGTLEERESIVKIFEDIKKDSGVWGVFCVLAFPGMGVEATGEERQEKACPFSSEFCRLNWKTKYGVQTFVYSSVMRMGSKYEDTLELSHKAKRNIENHCIDLGKKGLNWTCNLDGFIGSIGVAVLKKGLKPETEVAFIGSEDVSNVAAGVFANPQKHRHKILAVVGECCAMSHLEDAHQRATGKPIPAVPAPVAWMITKTNKGTQSLIEHIRLNHHARVSRDYPSANKEIALVNTAYKMKNCYE